MNIIEYRHIEYFIKISLISIFTVFFSYRILNLKQTNFFIFIRSIITILLTTSISVLIRYKSNITLSMIVLDIFIAFIFSKLTKRNIGYSLMISTISISINYVLYTISITITYIVFKFLNLNNEHIVFFIILAIYNIIFAIVYNLKKLKKGITFLKKYENNEYLGLLILNLSIALFFSFAILSNIKTSITIMRSLFIYVIIFSIILFITIQKSLQLYYKQKLQEREVAEIKEELNNKNKEIEELEKENIKLSKTNHSILHKQKSLEYELNQAILKNEMIDKKEIETKLQNLSKEISKEPIVMTLTKTNIKEIDNMLKYMQSECVKNKIDFELQINGNIHHMTNKYIGKEELEILLADHIKNAIIAINHSKNINKNILVRLGIIDGEYSLYIYDSSIEFEVETLKNLGIKPSTTHAKDGGTGMGFMNTFDTLKKYKASIEIHEYGKPSKDNFTKVIKIIFDEKNQFKISSYREKEIV